MIDNAPSHLSSASNVFAILHPYANYKPTNSPWLGNVPEHWGVHNLRTLLRRRNERNRSDLPLLSVARERGVFVRSLDREDENHNVIPNDLSNYKVARCGNLVINKMKAWQGSLGIAPCDGIVSPAYFVFDFNIHCPAFGQYLLRSKSYVAHFARASDGVRIGQWDLSVAGMRDIPIVLPPENEQKLIARFIAYASHRIDGAVRGKRRLIALLTEQKRLIVDRAITRGLDEFAPLKETGSKWNDFVPAHWKKMRAKDLYREVDERTSTGTEELLSVSHLTGVTPRSQKTVTMFKAASYVGQKTCQPGDLVINTMWAWMGALGVSRFAGIVSSAYGVYRPRNTELIGEYADLLLGGTPYVSEYNCRSTGIRSSRLRLYPEQFLRVSLFIPGIDEQRRIIDFVSSETKQISNTINATEREISLLVEYRARLIADVVTGKSDVRDAAAQLPSDEGRPFDPEAIEVGETFDEEAAFAEAEDA